MKMERKIMNKSFLNLAAVAVYVASPKNAAKGSLCMVGKIWSLMSLRYAREIIG